jgi:hypothetical protein
MPNEINDLKRQPQASAPIDNKDISGAVANRKRPWLKLVYLKSRSWRAVPRTVETSRLLDHLVGQSKQRRRYFKAEGLGRLQIDDELEFRGLLNRQIGRLGTL